MAKVAIFTQETGEEAVVHLHDNYSVDDAIEDHPEWSFRGVETLRDSNYYADRYNEIWVEDLIDLY